jgi:hypothetical protein
MYPAQDGDMDTSPSTESAFGVLAYFLFVLATVLVGPLEAVLGMVAYWLLGDDGKQTSS